HPEVPESGDERKRVPAAAEGAAARARPRPGDARQVGRTAVSRRTWLILLAVVIATVRVTVAPASPGDCAALRRHGQRAEAQACYRSLTLDGDPYLRAEGDWGLELYQDANNDFRAAVARDDRNAHYRVRWGRLLHERFNDAEAVALFAEAIE